MNSRLTGEDPCVAVELGTSALAGAIVVVFSLPFSSLSFDESERIVYPSFPSTATVRKQCEDRENHGRESDDDWERQRRLRMSISYCFFSFSLYFF